MYKWDRETQSDARIVQWWERGKKGYNIVDPVRANCHPLLRIVAANLHTCNNYIAPFSGHPDKLRLLHVSGITYNVGSVSENGGSDDLTFTRMASLRKQVQVWNRKDLHHLKRLQSHNRNHLSLFKTNTHWKRLLGGFFLRRRTSYCATKIQSDFAKMPPLAPKLHSPLPLSFIPSPFGTLPPKCYSKNKLRNKRHWIIDEYKVVSIFHTSFKRSHFKAIIAIKY